MRSVPLHVSVDASHPAYQWAKAQSDAVDAMGHIGTHLDCYTAQPSRRVYELAVEIIDCANGMPTAEAIPLRDFTGKAVFLYTGVLHRFGYGGDDYARADTFLDETALEALLACSPSFILIDGCGIGAHGEVHKRFDRRCEELGCFVIENVLLDDETIRTIEGIRLVVDIDTPSTGKPCKVFALCR
ncbi:hypothetical protein GGQ74_000550 [Desulfobaculum xiamenense]|uniref:Cyclase n=1 Tax=Desulfobaculum xiamenense TaxID=995050 RepID=A0A846QIJ3_9BACT|nr:hypothetical protein [Desulfobaculum xiamenense]NJB66910.1 hypothetical protein [Desulfobaculum xiamenense]